MPFTKGEYAAISKSVLKWQIFEGDNPALKRPQNFLRSENKGSPESISTVFVDQRIFELRERKENV